MTLTLKNLSETLERALRERANAEHKSLDQAAVDALARGLGLDQAPTKRRDLSEIAGTWVEDLETEAALEEQNRIDLELWQ
jgi:plasmid stability protein